MYLLADWSCKNNVTARVLEGTVNSSLTSNAPPDGTLDVYTSISIKCKVSSPEAGRLTRQTQAYNLMSSTFYPIVS